MSRVAVIGAGSWGTAVAALLGANGVRTVLWARTAEVVDGINETRRNPRYLVEVELPSDVCATVDLEEAVSGSDILVIATPSKAVHATAGAIRPYYDGRTPVVSLAKGLDPETLMRMTVLLGEVLGAPDRMAALSGPNHAEEVSRRIPSATVIAAADEELGVYLRGVFMSPQFRVYTNTDVVGVELAGASKNVIAVAAGISDGLGFGDNTKASLMTRGLAEMSRLGRAEGANPLTYMGLAGMGDLIATCTSRHSRNRALGERLASGGTVEQFEAETHMVAEGATSCVTVAALGQRQGIEMPITAQVRGIVAQGASPSSAVSALMGRDATDELHGIGLIDA